MLKSSVLFVVTLVLLGSANALDRCGDRDANCVSCKHNQVCQQPYRGGDEEPDWECEEFSPGYNCCSNKGCPTGYSCEDKICKVAPDRACNPPECCYEKPVHCQGNAIMKETCVERTNMC